MPREFWRGSQDHLDWVRVRSYGWRWNAEERRWIHPDGRTARNRVEIIAALDAGVDPRPCAPRPARTDPVREERREHRNQLREQRALTEDQILEALEYAGRGQLAPSYSRPMFSMSRKPHQTLAPDWQPNNWEA